MYFRYVSNVAHIIQVKLVIHVPDDICQWPLIIIDIYILQCFCCRCHTAYDLKSNVTTLVYNRGAIGVNDIIQCSFKASNLFSNNSDFSSKRQQSRWSVFLAMLWPTLMFITGFVGVFFTTIFLTKEGWRWDVSHEPQETCEMQNTY